MNTAFAVPEALMARHTQIVEHLKDNGLTMDRQGNVLTSKLTQFGFRAMPLNNLAAMYMARQGEVAFDMAWEIAKLADERLARGEQPAAPEWIQKTRPSNFLRDIHFLQDQGLDFVDQALESYAPAARGSSLYKALIRAKVRPFEWAVLVAEHPVEGIVGVYVISMRDRTKVLSDTILTGADGVYVTNMFTQHDEVLLKERRANFELFLIVQTLRTPK